MKKFLMVSTALALCIGSVAAFAKDGSQGNEDGHHGGKGKHMDHMFDKNDTNGDGVISKDEAISGAESRFKEMDADGDGKVTKEEAKAHHEKMRDKWKEMREDKRQGLDKPPLSETSPPPVEDDKSGESAQ